MNKKVIRQLKALNRFSIRNRAEGETRESYNLYLQRKEVEREALLKVKARNAS